jgi:cysteine desulfurase family protein
MQAFAEDVGASAGRGGYREALNAGQTLHSCRQRLARLLNAESPERIVFTHNGTAALNLAIKGLLRDGDHVVTTVMEHNSMLRPLNGLAKIGQITLSVVPADPATGLVAVDDLFEAVRPETRLIAIIHASNVTGALQPIERIACDPRRRGIPLLVDAAQSAGHVPIDVQAARIDLLAMPGHKGLLGPLGTGTLYVRPGLEQEIRPLIEGGTGSVSAETVQPGFMPDKYESGSHNMIGLAGLDAALQWIESQTLDALRIHEESLAAAFIERAGETAGLTLYGPGRCKDRVAVFSIRLKGVDPAELSGLLETEFGILTRAGLHCAPLAHEAIGTRRLGGTTRLSFGPFNTIGDIDRCVQALKQLAATLDAA